MLRTIGIVLGLVAITSNCGNSGDQVTGEAQSGSPQTAVADTTEAPRSTSSTSSTTTTPPTTTTEPAKVVNPEYAALEMQDNNSGEFEVYVKIWDQDREPIFDVGDASLEIWIRDENRKKLYQEQFVLTNNDLRSWTRTISGEEFSAYQIVIPIREVERSLSGPSGTVEATLRLPYGAFELSEDVRNLPEASEAERTAASSEAFAKDAIDLEVAEVSNRRWRVQPLRAGCYRHFGEYSVKDGVRVDLQISSRENSIETFFDDALLQTPDGLTIEPDYESSARGLDVIPGDVVVGFLMFIDIPCTAGTYRFVMSDYRSVYLDINFDLG